MKTRFTLFSLIALFIVVSFRVNAGQRTAVANGNWNTSSTWSPSGVPTSSDTVNIPAGFTVTIATNRNEACASLNLNSNSGASASSLAFSTSTSTLSVTNQIIVRGPTADATTTNLQVGPGTLTANNNIVFKAASGGADTRVAKITLTTGTCNFNRDLIFENTIHPDRIVIDLSGGAGRINLVRVFSATGDSSKGTLSGGSNSTFNYKGTSVPQTVRIGSTFQYHHLLLNNTSSSGATLGNQITTSNVTGNVRVQAGILVNGGYLILGSASDTFEVANSSTFYLTGESSFPSGWTNVLGATSTVSYAGLNQTIENISGGYGHLEFRSDSGAVSKTLPATALTVRGKFTVLKGLGTSVTVNANEALAIGDTVNIGASTTFNAGTFSHTVGGSWIRTGTFNAGTSTITFNGSNNLSIDATTFYNLTINKTAGTATAKGDLIVANDFAVNGGTYNTGTNFGLTVGKDFTLSGTFVANSSAISVPGQWNNSGTFTAGTSTVTLSGSSSQNVDATSFNDLVVNNTSGIILDGTIGIGGTLTLTNGEVTTGAFMVDVTNTASGAVAISNGFVNGTMKRAFPSSATGTYLFTDANTSITPASNALLTVTLNSHRNTDAPSDPSLFAIKRYYSIEPSAALTGTVRLAYAESEVRVGQIESDFRLWRNDGLRWRDQGVNSSNSGDNWVEQTGISSWSDWTIAEQGGSISGKKIDDLNGDGAIEVGEPALQNWLIRLAANSISLDSVQTQVDGSYSFTGLYPNQYVVSEKLEGGYQQTLPTAPGTYTIDIMKGVLADNKDFGNFELGTMSGMKFNDMDGNGVKDIGDNGISGWKIYIGGTRVDSTLTDANGNFTFTNLSLGSYTLIEEVQSGWLPTAPVGGTYSETITTSGTDLTGKNFGNFEKVNISGMKFNDMDGDGTKDAGDNGLSGWKIYLTGSVTDSAMTDANGNYSFVGLGPGTFLLSEETQAGWVQTTSNPSAITTASGTDVSGQNFGNFEKVSISGMKFNDMDGDGVKDAEDTGLSGWKIYLNGSATDSSFTDANGNYSFPNLGSGTYSLSEETQAGWVQTTNNPSAITTTSGTDVNGQNFGNFDKVTISGMKFNDMDGDGTKDAEDTGLSNWKIYLDGSATDSATTDANGNYSFTNLGPGTYSLSEGVQAGWVQTTTNLSAITTSSGTDVTEKNFGNFEKVTISGMKFNDMNGDGIKDVGDNGVSGWKIYLNGSASDSITTDANGNYLFTNLGPGTYMLSEAVQDGWTQTTANPSPITTSSGTDVSGQNFGNIELGTISGMKFNDMDGNGVKDIGDNGVSGWKIYIGGTRVDSTLTDANGNYSFTNLAQGSYTISEEVQSGWLQTAPVGGTYSEIITTSGTDLTGKNFGNFEKVNISGMKFNDMDGDGTKDAGDNGLSGWKIYLIGLVTDSTTTDVNGNYSFIGLGPGMYSLSEETQAGWVQTTSNPSAITTASGTDVSGQNFGNFDKVSISGMKFNDMDGDGVKDAEDTGLSNWKIYLNGSATDSATTDANGNYSFTNLGPGTYSLSEETQTGWVQTTNNPSAITTSSGTDVNGQNFGNFDKVSISGMKFNDIDGDGVKDAGDLGLSGWKIYLNGSATDSATTDANGNYSFINIGPGTYSLSEAVQSGWQQTTNNPSAITTSSGADVNGQNFGNFDKVTISGIKFNDMNGDGIKDVGDNGVSGWKIYLNGSASDSITTDANGNYSFTNLGPGTYMLSEAVQNGWTQTTANPSPIITSSGTDVSGQNFGNIELGTISGMKFNDMDGDGVKDAEDTGVSGWKIYISGIRVDSTLTDANGNFTFTNLALGIYSLSEEIQSGWMQTAPVGGTYSDTITTSGTDLTGKDFGNFETVSISGMKFNDMDGDGTKDAGDNGLSGWKIYLNGSVIDSATTDANGNYSFVGLGPGSYSLSEEAQAGWVQTTSNPSAITTASGTDVSGQNFGNFDKVSIAGMKFNDMDGDGVKDAEDTGLSGWKIYLNGSALDSATTDANGNYSFTNLGPGTYSLSEETQTGWVQTTNNPSAITTSSGTDVSGQNFGNFDKVSISGMKFNDMNGDGVKDAGDLGLSGWKIYLNGSATDSATTDANGNYTFSNLGPGTYSLSEAVQSGWQQTTTNPSAITTSSGTDVSGQNFGNFDKVTISGMKFNDVNGDGIKDVGDNGVSGWKIYLNGSASDSTTTDANGDYSFTNLGPGTYTLSEAVQNGWTQTTTNPLPITTSSGTDVSGQNFGNIELGTISGMKFNDMDGDGVKDAEDTGVSGWKIYLSGTVTDSVTTDVDGNYLFIHLPTGNYTISEEVQNGWQQTSPAGGTYSETITTSGTDLTGKNFGNFEKVSISGMKFNDMDGDGTKDAGDNGLSGWKIYLNGSVTDSATTDANGNYSFVGLGPGTYSLSEETQAGWVQTTSNPSAITTGSGTDVSGQDFGNFARITISGMKFNDVDGDGTKDAGDNGLSGWKIYLNGSATDSATTDANGNYSFVNLGPGTYNITEATQNGWVQTRSVNPITAQSGTDASNQDFGNFQTVSISGQKYEDMNANGAKDAGDNGLSGWSIQLYGDYALNSTTENFDAVTVPNLPTGWTTTTNRVAGGDFTTLTNTVYSSPNAIISTNATIGQILTSSVYNFAGSIVDSLFFMERRSGSHNSGVLVEASTDGGTTFSVTVSDTIKNAGTTAYVSRRMALPHSFDNQSNIKIRWRIIGNGTGTTGTLRYDDIVVTKYSQPLVGTSVTDGNGDYSFSDVGPGTYSLSEVSQAGWQQTTSNPSSISPSSGTNVTGQNFGNFRLGTFSGMKFNDVDGDGTKDVGDNGLSGWKIYLGGSAIDSAVTDVNGNYSFGNLANGNYTISEGLQSGWQQTAPAGGTFNETITTSGTEITGRDFGNFDLVTISGLKFNDRDGDGVKDAEDTTGVSGWKIYINGSATDSTTTDANGNYSFANLQPGTYTLSEAVQAGWVQTTSNPSAITTASGTDVGGQNFGNFELGTISGMKFNDTDGDGLKDAEDIALSGWKIYLAGTMVDSAITDANGSYTFSNLALGSYLLSEEQQNGWFQTSPAGGIYNETITTSGMDLTGKNFGNFDKVNISGMKFNDMDGDGVKDAEDTGLSNWKIYLNGSATDSATTDANGNYSFIGLGPGTYSLSEEGQAGWVQTTNNPTAITTSSGTDVSGQNFGNFDKVTISGMKFNDMDGNGTKDVGDVGISGWKIYINGSAIDSATTDANGNYSFVEIGPGTYNLSEAVQSGWQQTTSNPSAIITSSGTDVTEKNFGNFEKVTISGMKFNDMDGNETQDVGDNGISGWKIYLSGSATDSTITDANGNYSFINLGPGTYTLSEAVQNGWTQTTTNPSPITTSSGTDVSGQNFGNIELGTISGMKFSDMDGDGVKDAEDTGVSGWKIYIGGARVDSTLTDANGNFTFTNLALGSYTISEEVQNGWLQTAPAGGTYSETISTSGTDLTGKNFGNFEKVSISGMKFNDMDGDGTKDAEDTGLSGWKIYLNGSVIDSATTDANGNYSFVGLGPDTYSLSEESQTGWVQTTVNPSAITTSSGTDVSGQNFGNFDKVSIIGMKFNDMDGDGVKDAEDTGLSNWKIYLNGSTTDSSFTDANGNYSFTNLGPGTYSLSEAAQAGWVQTTNNPTAITTSSGTDVSGQNFGNFDKVTISGMKFNDMDGNGTKDVGDVGISGWKIYINGSAIDSATTDANGNYSFVGIGPGTYNLSEAVQSGWQQTTSNPSAITTSSGTDVAEKNFGNFEKISISGMKFNDMDGNGTQDAGDNGISGWKIYLSGSATDSAITDANGDYSFTNLGPGTYTLSEAVQNGWTQTTTNPSPITTSSGTDVSGQNFGNIELGTISGMKFNDMDGNGVKDVGDNGVSGWKIYIGGTRVDSTLTDANGNYSFTNLALGSYAISEEVQSGWLQTAPVGGTYSETITTGSTDLTGKNFGNFEKVTISGMKFNDMDGNGTQDAGDNGLSGWKIYLTGLETDSTTTDANGNYSFVGLGPGTYSLSEEFQTGWMQTTANPSDITTQSGTDVSGQNFGNFEKVSISGMKFNDVDGDGVKDAEDTGLSGWKIYLNGSAADSATTDVDGNYQFVGLGPGTYSLSEETQAGWVQTTNNPTAITTSSGTDVSGQNFGNFDKVTISGMKFNDMDGNGTKDVGDVGISGWKIYINGSVTDSATTDVDGNYSFVGIGPGTYNLSEAVQSGWQQTTSNPSAIITSSGTDVSGQNFGNFEKVTISGMKFNDMNGDGIKDVGDNGVSGWKIYLNGSASDSTTTDANGDYSFTNLGPGTYTLSEAVQNGWTQTTANPLPITTSSGTDVSGQNFGNIELGTISGMKFNDMDGNGTKDAGDTGIGGWKMYLSGTVTDSTTTDVDGNYSFVNLPQGAYTISEEVQSGWMQTSPVGGTYSETISTSGTNLTGRNFGNFEKVSISGMKFNDMDGDGTKDAGDNGLSGWKIYLTGLETDSTTTDANGNYSFVGLGPGMYSLSEETQTGWVQTTSNPSAITTSSGTDVSGQNFGNFERVSISGMKFNDVDGDGVKDAEDTGLAGWKIYLNGSAADSATTDVDGNYQFVGLVPGTYSLSEETQTGWVQTTNNPSAITTSSGTDVSGQNFGNFEKITISGMKFNDMDGNGTKDAGDVGISGWKIYINGSATDSATTDVDGNYSFTNLGPGTYSLSEGVQAGWVQTTTNPSAIITSSGTVVNGQNFGNFQLGIISGMKFSDNNGNGVKDLLENGLAGWILFIDANDNSLFDNGENHDTTDNDGNYQIGNLFTGTYKVREANQAGWTQTTANPADVVVTTSGQTFTGIEFGNFRQAIISGYKYEDMNGDGVWQSESEPILSGWEITATKGLAVKKDTTDANGYYEFAFASDESGTWSIGETVQANYTQTEPNTGTYSIEITSGVQSTGNDFGNFFHSKISGYKFDDSNGNGMWDDGETSLSGWEILASKGIATKKDTTDANGYYEFSFDAIEVGTWTITETNQSGWVQTLPVNNGDYSINIVSRVDRQNVNFGNFQAASISGYQYYDRNGNGVWDQPQESGLAGWEIIATKNSVVKKETTDANGAYQFIFTTSEIGDWVISETVQYGWFETQPQFPGTYTVTVSGGTNSTEKNFGNFQQPKVTGVKFNDLNGNGARDVGEPGLSGWLILASRDIYSVEALTSESGYYELLFGPGQLGLWTIGEVIEFGWEQTYPPSVTYSQYVDIDTNAQNKDFGNFKNPVISGYKFNDFDADGAQDAEDVGMQNWVVRASKGLDVRYDTTDESGYYNFTFIIPDIGQWVIDEQTQTGWTPTSPTGGNYTIQIVSALDSTNVNFGNFQNVSLSGIKYKDAAGDSSVVDDVPLSAWTMKLFKNAQLVGRTETGGGGEFSFSNIAPGTYILQESLKTNWAQTYPLVATSVSPVSDANAGPRAYQIVVGGTGVQSGGSSSNNDFANFEMGTISGIKFNDLFEDSSTVGDSVLQGWKIKLFKNGQLQTSQTTASNGSYLFTNLLAGTYVVQESLKAGWIQTYPRVANSVAPVAETDAGPRAYSVSIVSGTNATSKDFANFKLGTISGIKYEDVTGDSTYNVGDRTLSNWLIKLEKNNTVIDSMFTDETGAYSFVGLVSGTYSVKEVMQDGWTFTQPASGSYTYLVTSGMDLVNVNFGNFKLGSISGLKFYDYDSSGAKGSGEVGLRNFNILLIDENDIVVDTAKTTTYGTYLFDSVFAGNYKVQEAAKFMFTRTYPDSYYAVTMTSGLDTSGLDFGNAYDGDTVKMRTFLVEDYNSNKGRFKGLRDTIFSRILDKGRLIVGIPRPDSNNFYGWFRSPLTKYHSASTRFWSFNMHIIRNYLLDRNKPINRRRKDWKKYIPGPLNFTGEGNTVTYFGNFGNALSAEMTAAKTNIAASDSGIIPTGFGDLLYNNDSADVMNRADSLFKHWSVREILTLADSVLTMSRLLHLNGDTTFRWPQYYYELLYRTISKIDSSFYKKTSLSINELDTIHIQNPKYPTNPSKFLIVIKGVKGVKRLRDVKFLYRDPNKLPLLRQQRDYIVSLGEIPLEYSLEQNYPNPFNPVTNIQFNLPEPSVVTLKIYNILGQEITTLFNHEALDVGNHVIEFSGNDLPSGVYFYRLKVESVNELGQTSEVFMDVKKMLLIK